MHEAVGKFLKSVGANVSTQWVTEYPYLPGTTNSLRFVGEVVPGDQVLTTDVDMVFLSPAIWAYMVEQLCVQEVVAAFQGAWHHPKRKEIAPQGWTGRMRRLCGGHVMVTPGWYQRTRAERAKWAARLAAGTWGKFREADEVMLCRICEACGIKTLRQKFAWDMRGLHLGDFGKPWRWQKMSNMRRYLPQFSARILEGMLQNEEFCKVIRLCEQDRKMLDVWTNVRKHMRATKGVLWT